MVLKSRVGIGISKQNHHSLTKLFALPLTMSLDMKIVWLAIVRRKQDCTKGEKNNLAAALKTE